ncbi:MAG: hypothetical protein M9927_26280, partial [Anaerolineae bacterium]|nr:hypothetical protein [Anaerolineae bacterium]
DYPIIAVPRSVFEEQMAGAVTQHGAPLFSSAAGGESAITLRTTTRSDPFSIPSGSYTVGATQPAALPRQTSSTGTGYEAFVGDLYRRGAALAQSLTDDTRYQLYRDHILGSFGFANRKGEGLWVEGPVQIPAGPVRPGGSVFDVLSPEEYLPKGVTAIAESAPAGDMPDVARAGMLGAALEADNWKSYAIKTGAWHEPAQATWKGQVPWWMRHYGNQYYPSNEAGLREMLGTLLSRAPDEVPQELVDNPGLLKDYQRLVGYTLGHDVFEWEQVPSGYTLELMLSPKELDPTYWPAMAAVKGNEWASDIPLNVRERIQADWVREMESFQVLPRGQDWYRDYRDAFMGGSRVVGPAPYPGSPAAADAGFMTRELDANLVADWDIDAMKKAAAAVKKLGFTPEAQAAHELWQEIWPGLVEHIDFRPAQINRDFWAAVDKTAQAYKDVPKWMDDLFLRVEEAKAGFERFLYGDEPLWAFRGPYNPRAQVPIRRAGDPFDWLMERIDRLPPEQAEAARALMTRLPSNLDEAAPEVVFGRRQSLIDTMWQEFIPHDSSLADDFLREFGDELSGAAPAAAAPTALAGPVVQGPLSIPAGDELPLPASGSVGFEGNPYLAQAKGYSGAPWATMAPAVGDELTPEQAAATFGVFEGDNGQRLRGPQS